jgi:hypothetical protein
MSADLDTLLRDAAGAPSPEPDVDALWAGGRRRRRARHLGAGLSGVAAMAAVVLVTGVLDPAATTVTPEIVPGTEVEQEREEPRDAEPVEPPVDGDLELEDAPGLDEQVPELADPEPGTGEDDAGAPVDEGDAAASGSDPAPEPSQPPAPSSQSAPAPTPQPDPAAVADPCAPHVGGDVRAFIDVVAPVVGQAVSGGSIELVGCSSVYEATVSYRVLGGGGLLAEGFTTATFGGPQIGEFRETIAVRGTGPAVLEVFWEDAADGRERDLVRIEFELR